MSPIRETPKMLEPLGELASKTVQRSSHGHRGENIYVRDWPPQCAFHPFRVWYPALMSAKQCDDLVERQALFD